MATLVARPTVAPARSRSLAYDRLRRAAGVPFVLGIFLSFLGFAWDVQWHVDVGPDTFFTAPHLVLYSGIAVAGLTSLTVVLLTTFRYRGVTEGTVSVLGGRFRGPAGYVIGGVGATLFLAYGLVDQWWHSIYGFDVTLVSPPHVGLVLSVLITMIGCLCAFGAEVARAAARGRGSSWFGPGLGFAAATALLFAFVTPSAVDVVWDVAAGFGLPGGPNGTLTFLYSLMLLMSAAVLRRPGAATLVALMMTILRLGLWYLVPWMTGAYATAVGLFLRDNTDASPVVPGVLPPYLLLAGIVVDLVLLAGRRFGWNVWLSVLLAGGLVPVALELITPEPSLYVAPHDLFPVRPELLSLGTLTSLSVATIVVGAVAGLLGWVIGFVIRHQEHAAPLASAASPTIAGVEAR